MGYTEDGRRFLRADGWLVWTREDHVSDQKKGVPRPPSQKPYPPDAALIDLIPAGQFSIGDAPLREVIDRRRSRRSFTTEALSLEELSFLLWATQGLSRVSRQPGGRPNLRTVPSGGCTHAFETYLAINNVSGVMPGLYRYLPLEHKLLSLKPDPEIMGRVVEGCRGQTFVGQATVVFIWTAVPYRTEWRYDIVAHKIIAQDSGHLCQNLYLAAEAIGTGTCAIGAYNQEKMDALLGVDGQDEFTIYAAPVGRVEERRA